LLEIPSRFFEHNAMAFLLLFFTVALSLCVVGLVVLALASILGSVRDDWKIKKPEREPRPGDY
jgi:purine-cytosine permease-like protein